MTFPDESTTDPNAGLLLNVMLSSPQVLSDTPRTSKPIRLVVSEKMRSVADDEAPWTLNLR